ncbi:3beta-hydroxysteroid dehydrogenase [Chytriomyces sp. MP71]|nr:3beta-hydroxysteroid dehydrogenase [Chytriomyces sp. MP71]
MVGLSGKKDKWLVVGGCGFLGRAIVDQLLARNESVAVFDLRQGFDDDRVEFFTGDLTKRADVDAAVKGRTVVIHTASPPHGLRPQVYIDVNVHGTRNVIDACIAAGVTKLVYTSSAGVVYNGGSLIHADESIPYCEKHVDTYNETKAAGEAMLLQANGRQGLATCAIRPSAIFGPRDGQALVTMIQVVKEGKCGVQIGNNEALMDFTYVDNAAYAHILAGQKMTADNGIGGEAFFVTNDSPVFSWDFMKMVYTEYGAKNALRFILPMPVAILLATIVEFFVLLLSPIKTIHPTFTVFRMKMLGNNKYHSIEKAKRLLGYKPLVPLGEGIKRGVQWFKDQERLQSKSHGL